MTLSNSKLSLDNREAIPLIVYKFYGLWGMSFWVDKVTQGSSPAGLFPTGISFDVEGEVV